MYSRSMSNCDDQVVADQALDLFAEQTEASEENSKYALVGWSPVILRAFHVFHYVRSRNLLR